MLILISTFSLHYLLLSRKMAAADIPILVRVLALSVRVARRAGCIIREVQAKGKLDIVEKGIDDPQTIADRRSEGFVR